MEPQGTPHPKFSFWVGVCFTLNYVVGSGFLTLPWGFQKIGDFLGVTVLAVFGYFSVVATVFILEASARASKILERTASDIELPKVKTKQGYSSIDTVTDTKDDVMLMSDNSMHAEDDKLDTAPKRRIELTEMCELFFGPTGRQLFTFLICIYMYGTLWAYCSVFAKSFAVQFALSGEENPEEGAPYFMYLFVFGCIVVPLSLMELSEQIYIQVTLTILRVVLLSFMLLSAGYAFMSCGDEFGDLSSTTCKADGEGHDDLSLYSFHFNNLYQFLPLAAYAYIFHHSVPALSAPIEDKRSLGRMFAIALGISFAAYSLLGVVVSAYFGPHTQSSSNLDWQHYVGIRNSDGSIPWYSSAVAMFVVLFPAIDVASAYPLNAFTLGNNIMSAYYGEEMRHHERSRLKTSIFRLIAALPPFLGAALVSDLSHITAYTGLTGFAIAFVVPALLAYCSSQKMRELGLSDATVHSSVWTGRTVQYVVGTVGVILVVAVMTCQMLYGTDGN